MVSIQQSLEVLDGGGALQGCPEGLQHPAVGGQGIQQLHRILTHTRHVAEVCQGEQDIVHAGVLHQDADMTRELKGVACCGTSKFTCQAATATIDCTCDRLKFCASSVTPFLTNHSSCCVL